jgi:hypothetical protein
MINQALELLKQNKTGSFKMNNDQVLAVTPNALVIRFFHGEALRQEVLAVNVNKQIIGNSSRLTGLLSHRGQWGAQVTEEQTFLSDKIPMIPFETIKQAELSLSGFKTLDKGQEETLYRSFRQNGIHKPGANAIKEDKTVKDFKVLKKYKGWTNEMRYDVEYKKGQHFTGAQLFKIQKKVFLLDVDRNELEHGIINPFLVELSNPKVKTIAEAYESLKPQEVVSAEAQGLKVLRQGEWFFIPANDFETARAKKAIEERLKTPVRWGAPTASGTLRAGRNRPNEAELMGEVDGKFYVSGTISHSGREHADLVLTGFYRAIPNTSQTSWTITGEID